MKYEWISQGGLKEYGSLTGMSYIAQNDTLTPLSYYIF